MLQLLLDFNELEKLEDIAERPRSKQLLLLEKVKLQNEIDTVRKIKTKSESPSPSKPKIPVVKITSYGNFVSNLLVYVCSRKQLFMLVLDLVFICEITILEKFVST